MRERCAIARAENRGFPLSRGQKLKRNHVGLQNSAAACFARHTESLSKGETPKTDVPPSANVAKFEPVAIRKRARALYFALNEPAERAMISARDRLIVDKQKRKECICAPLLHLVVPVTLQCSNKSL